MGNVWTWLDGRKTIIGAVVAVVVDAAAAFGATAEVVEVIKKVADMLILLGLGHKGIKKAIGTK